MIHNFPEDVLKECLLYLDVKDTRSLLSTLKSTDFKKTIVSLCKLKTGNQVWIKCPCTHFSNYTEFFQPTVFTTVEPQFTYTSIVVVVTCPCGIKHKIVYDSVANLHKSMSTPETTPRYESSDTILLGYFSPISAEELCVGNTVDAMDLDGVWYTAKVLKTTQDSVLVHYTGWSQTFDETIPNDSFRLAKKYTHTKQFSVDRWSPVDFKKSHKWFSGIVKDIIENVVTIVDLESKHNTHIYFNEDYVVHSGVHTVRNGTQHYRVTYSALSVEWKSGNHPVYLNRVKRTLHGGKYTSTIIFS